jgi:indolepyruvate decarboxylase
MSARPSIGHYLLTRLYEGGVHDVFGVPGDYILRFYQQLTESPLRHIGTTREDTAAFGADGYARLRGLGAVAVTYGVGALNVVNALGEQISAASGAWLDMQSIAERLEFPVRGEPMTVARLIARLNRFLTPSTAVVCDTGDCLFAAVDLRVHQDGEFLASAFYTTMGFAVPAALGAQIARPDRCPLVLVDDGAFQMTGTELSTVARLGLNPIVIVFNNRGYSTERFILDGPFNDISAWRFDRLGELFGPLQGFEAKTEDQFEAALMEASAIQNMPALINVHLSPGDSSPAVRRLGEYLEKRL